MRERFRRIKHIQLDIDNKSNHGRQYVAELESCFESIHYDINLDAISSCMLFSEVDYVFLSIYC